jgi:hypothetical protein
LVGRFRRNRRLRKNTARYDRGTPRYTPPAESKALRAKSLTATAVFGLPVPFVHHGAALLRRFGYALKDASRDLHRWFDKLTTGKLRLPAPETRRSFHAKADQRDNIKRKPEK